MSAPILATKLFIPVSRPEHVPRAQLIEQLNSGLHGKLTLLSAPAGFGKTTLVTEWLNHLKRDSDDKNLEEIKTAWLSLDDHDNDPVRFLTYFITALNRIEEGGVEFGQEALNMLQSPQSLHPETILTALINDIAVINIKMVLVLDDYHLIDTETIHEALNFLIENQPSQFHLVIATREDPLLSLSRLRVRGQITELRAADLCFSSAEIAKFLNQVMGLDLKAADIAVLETRTEGWIAGLQLAALSMKGKGNTGDFIQSFAGSNRLVLDYLIDEVFEQQSTELQTFLLQTSILDRLTGPMCDAVCFNGSETRGSSKETASGQEILEILERANLFIIPLDDERCWYRYHHLFADLLRQRLQQRHPELMPKLHQRASVWYADQGLGEAAIDHALRGADYKGATALIDQYVGGNYEQISSVTLQRWLAAFPVDLLCSQPQLCLLQAWNQFTSGQLVAADQSLQTVAKLLKVEDQISNWEQNALNGRAAAIRSFVASYSGNLLGTIKFAQQALEVLPADESSWRSAAQIALGDAYAAQGKMNAAHQIRSEALELSKLSEDPYIQMIANLNLAETIWQQGNAKQVGEICARQEQFAEKQGLADTTIMGWLYGLWGEALAEGNLLDQALAYTQKGVKLADARQDVLYICYSKLHRVRVLFSAGDLDAAETTINEMEQAALECDLPQWATSQIAAWQVRIWLAQGNLEAATSWVIDRGLTPTDEIPFWTEVEYIAMARVWLAQGQVAEIGAVLDQIQVAAEIGSRYLRLIEIYLLQALVTQTMGELSPALTFLEQALRLAESKGIIQTFVDEGSALAQLLYVAVKQEIAPAYVQRIIAAFPVETEPQKVTQPSQDDEWVESLTERETEILQHIAEGLTNPEIGNRLYLSANTVKAHARTIYSKLGVNNRTQAVAKGRTLGIISDQ
jgi:LuxR family maltose regulon positive regulatory protein